MATHAQNIANLRNAVYGEQVRGSMIELFEEDYNLVKDGVGVGTAVSSSSSSTTGFSDGAVYINNSTWHLFKLEGTAWADKGVIQGTQGESVTGAVDNGDGTFYLTLSDGTRTSNIATIQGIQGPTGPQGPAGSTGPAGRSVTSIQMTGTGKQHPIVATYSDATTETVGIVQDGADGSGTGDMSKSTYDPSDHGYVDKAAGVTDGTNVLTYTNLNNKANAATSLSGYGITDAYTKTEADGKYMGLPTSSVTSGKVATSNGSGGFTWETPASGVTTYAALTDTDLTGLGAGDYMKYDSTASKWVVDSALKNKTAYLDNNGKLPAAKVDGLGDGTLSILKNNAVLGQFTANQSGPTTIDINTDSWTAAVTLATVGSDLVAVFDNLNDSYGYDPYGVNELLHYTAVSKTTGTTSGTVKLTYTFSDGTSGVSQVKLRVLK